MLSRLQCGVGAAVAALFTSILCLAGEAPEAKVRPQAINRPRLAVLLLFDQMRGDYLRRWRTLFGPDGFRRLQEQGASFTNCHYPYSDTYTGAGHASVATGCSPDVHGIIGNFWYDRTARQYVTAAGTERYQPVPAHRSRKGKPDTGSYSPERLLAPTLADSLKEASAGRCHVVSLSLKDRSAALPGGRHPDACYWFEIATGRFETSTYYRDAPHPWVAELDRSGAAGRWFGSSWTRLRPDLNYTQAVGPDDVVGEGTGFSQGRTFPHRIGGAPLVPDTYYNALFNSPFANELLLDLVERAVEGEQLGHHAQPDLLCVSFSSNDPIGHTWGPDSQEVLDVTLRADRIVARLLAFLDQQVGRGRYAVVLTSDHGVCPVPDVARRRGLDAGRISPTLLSRRADDFLREKFGKGKERWIEAMAEGWFYLDRDTLTRHGLSSKLVESALAEWLVQQHGIAAAFTRSELAAEKPPSGDLAQRVRRSFHPDRSGDVVAVPRPYHQITSFTTGTNHGTPYPYDTHVPLLVFGPGVATGVREEKVEPLVAPVILARLLGVPPPAKATVPAPAGLVRGR